MARSFALTPELSFDWIIGSDFSLAGEGEGDEGEGELVDHSEKRVEFVEWAMRWTFHTCLEYGVILVAKNKTTGNILGVICTLPPENNFAADTTSLLRFHVWKIGMKMKSSPPDILGKDALRRFEFMGKMQTFMHMQAAAACDKKPWYIFVVATSLEAQGTGCGTMLLQAIHHLADQDKADTILETAGAANIGFYCRPALGYQLCGPEVSSADRLLNKNGSDDDPVFKAQSLVRHPIIATEEEK